MSQQDSLSQIIENTIGNSTILNNGMNGCDGENFTYEILEQQANSFTNIEGENYQSTEVETNNADNKKSSGSIGYEGGTEAKGQINIISMPTVEI